MYKRQNEGHEGNTIELALSVVFASIIEVRSSAIVIDKHKMSLNSINKVIPNDIYYWIFVNVSKIQIMGRIIFCDFHVMKVSSENLLTRVLKLDK